MEFIFKKNHSVEKKTNNNCESCINSGPGTFFGKETRKISLEATTLEGWWLDRMDLPNSLPIRVGIANVWTTGQIVSNIVLRSGNSHNYVRMVEHLIALRMGIGIDNVMIRLDSGDPPLLTRKFRCCSCI